MGRKLGMGLRFLFEEGGLGPHLTKSRLGRGLALHTKWHLNPLSHLAATGMGLKLGAVPLWGGGAGCQCNTMWPGPRPTMHAKFHIDPFNRLATLHQRYRQQKQTGQTDRHERQRSDSIG